MGNLRIYEKILVIIGVVSGLKSLFDFSNLIYPLIFLLVVLFFLIRAYIKLSKQPIIEVQKSNEEKPQNSDDLAQNQREKDEILNEKFNEVVGIIKTYAHNNPKNFAKNIQRNLNIYLNFKEMTIVLIYLTPESFKDVFFLLKPDYKEKISSMIDDVKNLSRNDSYEIIFNFLDTYIKDEKNDWYIKNFKRDGIDVMAELQKPECKMEFDEPFKIEEMSEILSKENTQIISAVLISLTYNLSKAILDTFDEIKRKEVVKNMANINEISQSIIQILNKTLNEKLKDYERRRLYLQ